MRRYYSRTLGPIAAQLLREEPRDGIAMKDFIARAFADYKKERPNADEHAFLCGMFELNRFRLHCDELRRALESRLNELKELEYGSGNKRES